MSDLDTYNLIINRGQIERIISALKLLPDHNAEDNGTLQDYNLHYLTATLEATLKEEANTDMMQGICL